MQIEIDKNPTDIPDEEIFMLLEEECEYIGYARSGERLNWFDWDEEMKNISKVYPGILFYIHGEGEEPEDLWDAYVKNGKLQYCPAQITYDEYDPEKLK